MAARPIKNIPQTIESDLRIISLALMNSALHIDENYGYFSNGEEAGIYAHKSNEEFYLPELERFRISKPLYHHAKDYILYDKKRDYAFKLSDGALLQIEFLFAKNVLAKQRLAYIQRPFDLSEIDYQYQDEEELFENEDSEEIEADFTDTLIIAQDSLQEDEAPEEENKIIEQYDSSNPSGLVNFRFDYDPREHIAKECLHPKTHLTLSNNRNCRIPVSSPMTALQFTSMIIQHFYSESYEEFESFLRKKLPEFQEKPYTHSFFPKESEVFRVHAANSIL